MELWSQRGNETPETGGIRGCSISGNDIRPWSTGPRRHCFDQTCCVFPCLSYSLIFSSFYSLFFSGVFFARLTLSTTSRTQKAAVPHSLANVIIRPTERTRNIRHYSSDTRLVFSPVIASSQCIIHTSPTCNWGLFHPGDRLCQQHAPSSVRIWSPFPSFEQ